MKKIISLTLALITVLTLTVSTLATAVTAQAVSDVSDSMDYICFSAVRYMGIKVKYRPTASSSVNTFESKYADGSDQNFCGFIGRSVDKSYKYTNNEKLGAFNYYYGICTEEHLNQSGGVEVGSSAEGVQDSIKYKRSDEVFNVSYDDGKTLPADWVFKCFYYANQIAVEQGYDITELEKGYWTGDRDKDLSTLGTYNSDVEKGALSHLNATSDLGFAIQTSAKRVFSFLFTEKSDGSLTYNDSVVIESATCLRGHKNVDAWREESADIKHLIELCGQITKRAIEDEDGISDKLFRIEGKGAWAMTNPDGETKSYLKFYIPVESKYLEDFQRMAVFSTEYTMPDDYEKGQIVVQKKDTNGNALKGAEFTIYDINGKIPEALENTSGKLITDENGYAATAVQGADYRRLNLEDSPFAGSNAGKIRAILQEGFYIVPIDGESNEDLEKRVNDKVQQLAKASGADGLTAGEAIAATQCAIWRTAHGPILTFPKFCRYVFNPSQTKYADLCSYSTLKSKNNTAINDTVKAVYDYLLSLEPVAATQKVVSPASFEDLNRPELIKNDDGTYNISVTATVNVDIQQGDILTLKAQITEDHSTELQLTDGKQTAVLVISNVPSELAESEVTLSISGQQSARGFYYFDANGERSVSQAMVGYSDSRLPVYAEVVATDDRTLSIFKSTKLESGAEPISDIVFDIYLAATAEEYASGEAELPPPSEFVHPDIAEYTLITDENGKASFNFLHHGLPDGVYLIVERNHPNIVKPLDPFYLSVPSVDPATNEMVYDIAINPKNELKGNIKIEKDVITIGNDEASVNAYEDHTWIIGATIPEDISNAKSYVITDELDKCLDYVGNMKVQLDKKDDSSQSVQLIADTDYTVTLTDVDSLSENKPSDSFKVSLTSAGMVKIANSIGSNAFSDYMLRIYFDAQINANAVMSEQIPNAAEIKYVNASDLELTKRSDKPYVYTGAVNLLKVDAKDGSKTLSGAVFEVYRIATADELGANDSRITEIHDVVEKVIKVPFFDNSSLSGDKVYSVSSDENGKASIYGLAYGKYYLIETSAPSGYNTLGKTLTLSIDSESHTDEKAITIENESGIVLPSTGGIGTTVFTVSGIILIVCACVLLVYKRKAF